MCRWLDSTDFLAYACGARIEDNPWKRRALILFKCRTELKAESISKVRVFVWEWNRERLATSRSPNFVGFTIVNQYRTGGKKGARIIDSVKPNLPESDESATTCLRILSRVV